MSYLNPRIFDNGLTILDTEADQLHLCSQQPADYDEATTTFSLGSKAGISVGSPTDRSGGGRKVVVAAIDSSSPGTVSTTGAATHYAIVDSVNERLLAVAPITAPQSLTAGNPFTTETFDIGITLPS